MKRSALASLVYSLPLAVALLGCQAKTTAGGQNAKAKKAAPAAKTDATKAAPTTKAAPAAETPTPPPEVAKGPPPTLPKDPLGSDRIDPGWFRKTIFGDKGKVLDTKRSQADEQGRFSSLIRFELTGMDTTQCAEHLENLVKGDMANLAREEKQPGRIQLEGSTDRYKATLMCGEAKGKTIAYVSYQWT